MYDLDSPDVEDFLTKWFANGKFQFGQKRNKTALNLAEYKAFILNCKKNKEPAFSSVSPKARIERIFWEFDSDIELNDFKYDSPLLDAVWDEAMLLHSRIEAKGGNPLIVYSGNRGFHVWVYAFSTEIPEFPDIWEDTGKAVYKRIQTDVLGDPKDFKFYDKMPTNVNSLARIPFSCHQKSIWGNQVVPLTKSREPFMPKVEDYISHPLDHDFVYNDMNDILHLDKKIEQEKYFRGNIEYQHNSNIRGCILEAMALEPTHYTRLAFVMDAIYAGLADDDIHALMKAFTKGDDYNRGLTQYQIDYQRERVKSGMKPPTNETLVEWGILKELPKPAPDPWRDKKA
jgi:hypothetical protein